MKTGSIPVRATNLLFFINPLKIKVLVRFLLPKTKRILIFSDSLPAVFLPYEYIAKTEKTKVWRVAKTGNTTVAIYRRAKFHKASGNLNNLIRLATVSSENQNPIQNNWRVTLMVRWII